MALRGFFSRSDQLPEPVGFTSELPRLFPFSFSFPFFGAGGLSECGAMLNLWTKTKRLNSADARCRARIVVRLVFEAWSAEEFPTQVCGLLHTAPIYEVTSFPE